METDQNAWNDRERADGVRVTQFGQTFVALHPTKPTLVSCPCCSKPFATERAAKLVADALWPLH